jgi:hypothetical protein
VTEHIDWAKGEPWDAVKAYARWREAIEAAESGDSSTLVALFRSELSLGYDARLLIADLLERRPLLRRPGRQATPAYRLTEKEARVAVLKQKYRFYREKRKQSAKDALRSVLREEKRIALGIDHVNPDRNSERASDMPYVEQIGYTDDKIDELITPAEEEALADMINGRRGSTRRMERRRKGSRP